VGVDDAARRFVVHDVRDERADPPTLVCPVGSTALR